MRAFVVLALLVPVRMAAQQGAGARAGQTRNDLEGAARLHVVTAVAPIPLLLGIMRAI